MLQSPKPNIRKLIILFIALSVCLLHAFPCFSQEANKFIQKADTYYEAKEYNKALKYYLKAIDLDAYYGQANLKCARCYEKLGKYEEADHYFSIVFKQSAALDPALFLEYGELQMKLGHPELARSYFVSYNNLIENGDLRAIRYIKSIEDIDKYYSDSSFITINRLKLNQSYEDYNPIEYQNKLYFETSRAFADNSPSLRSLCYSSIGNEDNNGFSELKGDGASKYQGAGFTFSRYSGELIQSKKVDESDKSRFVLVRSSLESKGIQISKSVQIVVDSFDYNIEFPTLNNSGEKLIFASETPMGPGGLDLYISIRNSIGYCRPRPLNNLINTLGDECYPYLANDSILFFSSKGQGGLGGFDIYYVNLNNQSSIPVNLGYPINSRFDDYGFSLSESGLKGYFVSIRASDNTLSDIYSYKVIKLRALGVVTDERTRENLKNIEVDIVSPEKPSIQIVLADNGYFTVNTEPGDEFDISFKKEGYMQKGFHVSTSGLGQTGLFEENIGDFRIRKELDTLPIFVPEKEPIAQNAKKEVITRPVKKIISQIQSIPLSTQDSIKFRVQIAACRVPLDVKSLKAKYPGNREIFMYMEEGWYKYAIGAFNSYFEAKRILKQCGVNDAFIAAYSGTKKLVLMSAIREIYSIPAQIQSKNINQQNKQEIEKDILLYFPSDVFEADKTELIKLDSAIRILLSDVNLQVEIDGHTDTMGSFDYNFGLGAVRAKYVKDYLVSKGVDQNRITTTSFGETKLRKHGTEKGNDSVRNENRRVEVIVYKP